MKTCDGCGYESDDDEWMHTFDHPLKMFGHRRIVDEIGHSTPAYQEPVTACGFCYASVVGSRLSQYPDQREPIIDELYREFTLQHNMLREETRCKL